MKKQKDIKLRSSNKLFRNKVKFKNSFFEFYETNCFVFFYTIFNRKLLEAFKQTVNNFTLTESLKSHTINFTSNSGILFDQFKEISMFFYTKFFMRSLKKSLNLSRGLMVTSKNLKSLLNFNLAFQSKGVVLSYVKIATNIFSFKYFFNILKKLEKRLTCFSNDLKFTALYKLLILMSHLIYKNSLLFNEKN